MLETLKLMRLLYDLIWTFVFYSPSNKSLFNISRISLGSFNIGMIIDIIISYSIYLFINKYAEIINNTFKKLFPIMHFKFNMLKLFNIIKNLFSFFLVCMIKTFQIKYSIISNTYLYIILPYLYEVIEWQRLPWPHKFANLILRHLFVDKSLSVSSKNDTSCYGHPYCNRDTSCLELLCPSEFSFNPSNAILPLQIGCAVDILGENIEKWYFSFDL